MQKLFEPTQFKVKPFLKWAGGKTQIIKEIESKLPEKIKKSKKIKKYFEPFVGGGAFFFYLVSNYKIKNAFLYDINKELILTYRVIKNDPEELINELISLEKKFLQKDNDKRKEFYLYIRKKFNTQLSSFDFKNYSLKSVERASYTIFMNKTCFNGLFRLNKKGEFNVPMGRYNNPKICDIENIRNVSLALKIAEIYDQSFEKSKSKIDKNSLIYLDPPYRPLNKTSHFTNYSENKFTEKEQLKLAEYINCLKDEKRANFILSNCDPKNENKQDNFFDELYSGFTIERVKAKRVINSNASKRGFINEILVCNQ